MKPVQLALLALVLGIVAVPARSEVAVQFSFGEPVHHWRPQRFWHRPWGYGYPATIVTPLAVPPPVAYGELPAPVPVPDARGYGADWAALNGRLQRLQNVVQRQYEHASLSQEQFDRYADCLDRIRRDERARAYDRGGYLTSADFEEFSRRADAVGQQIEIALGE